MLSADRAAFTRVAETINGVRREPDVSLPLDAAIKQIVLCLFIYCHLPLTELHLLLVLSRPSQKKVLPNSPRGSGKNGASDRLWEGGKGPRAPKELIGRSAADRLRHEALLGF